MSDFSHKIVQSTANYFDICILETGFLRRRILTVGRLVSWTRCEQTDGGYGNWFLIFVYPLYKIAQVGRSQFCKDAPPANTNFICLFMHGREAVDVIHKFTTYKNKFKFAIAFADYDKHSFHFSTSANKRLTYEVNLIDSLIFLSGNITPLTYDFDSLKRRELAHIERYISTKGEFCSAICKIADKDIGVIIIFEEQDGFNASATELEHELEQLNLLTHMHVTQEDAASQSDKVFPLIDLTEPEDRNTLQNISENSSDSSTYVLAPADNTNQSLALNNSNSKDHTESNQFETSQSQKNIESRINANSEKLVNVEKIIEPVCDIITQKYEIFRNRRVTDSYDFGSSRNNQPAFLPTSFKILDSLQSINMSIMIDCSSQTELRSRGAYDLEFDKFLANKYNKEMSSNHGYKKSRKV